MRALCCLLLFALGCPRDDGTSPPVGTDSACIQPTVSTALAQTNTDKVDLLLMIDNSGSMGEEQATFVRSLRDLVLALASGQSSSDTYIPVADLRIGVVSSDMGVGGNSIPLCEEASFGDDGILVREGMGGAGCSPVHPTRPPFLTYRADDGGSQSEFTEEASCLANLGTQGCGFEQPLESVLKAVTPESSSTEFIYGSRPHGDTLNQGFVRDDSILAVIVLTNEDDCSAVRPELFDRDATQYVPEMELRCWRHPDAVHSITRYVDGLLELRAPERLVFAAITGVPVDLTPIGGDWETIVGEETVRDPRMVERPDPAIPSQLTPSCSVTGRGNAYPPVRIAGVAAGLEAKGASAVVQSICQSDFSAAMDHIADAILRLTDASCLPRPLETAVTGGTACSLAETLDEGGCTGPGRIFREIDTGRRICTVCQGDESGAMVDTDPECRALGTVGWFYNESANSCPAGRQRRIEFLPGAEPSPESELHLICPDSSRMCE